MSDGIYMSEERKARNEIRLLWGGLVRQHPGTGAGFWHFLHRPIVGVTRTGIPCEERPVFGSQYSNVYLDGELHTSRHWYDMRAEPRMLALMKERIAAWNTSKSVI